MYSNCGASAIFMVAVLNLRSLFWLTLDHMIFVCVFPTVEICRLIQLWTHVATKCSVPYLQFFFSDISHYILDCLFVWPKSTNQKRRAYTSQRQHRSPSIQMGSAYVIYEVLFGLAVYFKHCLMNLFAHLTLIKRWMRHLSTCFVLKYCTEKIKRHRKHSNGI